MAVCSDNTLWQTCQAIRKRQRFFGRISAVFIAATLFCLADGLYSSVRVGSDVLELLPGQSLMFSGPSPYKNPLNSDVQVRITPEDSSLRFVLDGFFASYWFGSAMWRGSVQVDATALPGQHDLLIHFRGASPKSAQKFMVIVWEDKAAQRAGAASVTQRLTGVKPVLPGVFCGVVALAFCTLTYIWGRFYFNMLAKLGFSEILRVVQAVDGWRVFCLSYGRAVPREGALRRVLTMNSRPVGEAKVITFHKETLELSLPPDAKVSIGHIVELWPANP
ncbi:MAG: hypothetical protein LBN28_00565 [Desulfovibrio sp.]|jgi:hypothetical protein|nr:hypothetical protein [Desulfovibrio sp.]